MIINWPLIWGLLSRKKKKKKSASEVAADVLINQEISTKNSHEKV